MRKVQQIQGRLDVVFDVAEESMEGASIDLMKLLHNAAQEVRATFDDAAEVEVTVKGIGTKEPDEGEEE